MWVLWNQACSPACGGLLPAASLRPCCHCSSCASQALIPCPPPLPALQLARRGGLRSTLLYNLVGGGEWDVLVMNALIGMGPGGVPVSMSLLQQEEPDPAVAAAAARAMGHGERGFQAAEAAAAARQQQAAAAAAKAAAKAEQRQQAAEAKQQ